MNQKIKNIIRRLRQKIPNEQKKILQEYRQEMVESEINKFKELSNELDNFLSELYENLGENLLETDNMLNDVKADALISKMKKLNDPLINRRLLNVKDGYTLEDFENISGSIFYLAFEDQEPLIGGLEIIENKNLNLN